VKQLDCTASIVVYNHSPEMIRSAAEGFLSCSLNSELHIVDNSQTQSLNTFAMDLPIKYHFYGCNVGYGRAHNWAISHSKESRYHIIINPDIIIFPEAIEHLVDFMDKNNDIGMVCPRVLNEDGSDQFLNKRYPTIFDLFARRFIPRLFHPLLKKRLDHYEMRDVGYNEICDVESMSGAFMFCRTKVLKAIGGFDPRYFLYFEDFDLCRRFQEKGYRTVYYPNAKVIHLWERAAHKNFKMMIIFTANMCRYFNKWGWEWL
jgi:GT2 family glycosyltransferase